MPEIKLVQFYVGGNITAALKLQLGIFYADAGFLGNRPYHKGVAANHYALADYGIPSQDAGA
jgi:hypothetical protein